MVVDSRAHKTEVLQLLYCQVICVYQQQSEKRIRDLKTVSVQETPALKTRGQCLGILIELPSPAGAWVVQLSATPCIDLSRSVN